ncbi:MAG: tripartite tricarboxylate transporter substrate binding protein [Proteobacteria bacterium]|nr:tripartite tricarboxylate transporter substrate binding protein [Pseudomonadota bacterium]
MLRTIRKIAVIAGLLVLSWPAAAQYPNRPVRIIVPFPAGSASDTVTRIVAQYLSTSFGQPVVVENKPGADGSIAASEIVRTAPDGYTLLMATNSPMSAVPAMRRVRPYDPMADFTPISFVGRFNYFVVINSGVPAKTLSEFFDYARKNPAKINYGTGNTTGIVTTAQLMNLAGVKMMHIPYKGEPPAITDMVAGRVEFMVATQTTTLPFVKDGKLVALATTSSVRSRAMPDVPTIAEAGFGKVSIVPYAALFAPPKTPPEIIERINRDVNALLGRPDIKEKLETQFFEASGSTPAQLTTFIGEQLEVWSKAVNELGLRE